MSPDEVAAMLPRGWKVWASTTGPAWCAVPAPAGTRMADAIRLPRRVCADTPDQLVRLCKARYGWYDTCRACDVLARECGHPGPEPTSWRDQLRSRRSPDGSDHSGR